MERDIEDTLINEGDEIDLEENIELNEVDENITVEDVADEDTTIEECDILEIEGEPLDEEVQKKGFFSKKNKKDKKDEQIEELNDRLKRNLAEFENFRKRTEKEKSAMYEIGAKSVIEKLLPVLDNFERGLGTISEEEKATAFANGMDMTYNQLLKLLEEIGVKPIEAVGEVFNPDLHNAVMHVEDENFGENTICEEFQKGYVYRDSVVRYSMVKVAN